MTAGRANERTTDENDQPEAPRDRGRHGRRRSGCRGRDCRWRGLLRREREFRPAPRRGGALREAAADGHVARRSARPADSAAKLGTTEVKLQEAFTAAHKAQAKARIDQAGADGKITKEYGEELKAEGG